MNEYEFYAAPQMLPPKTEYTGKQSVFAILSLVMGYFFMKFVFAADLGLSVTVFVFLFLAFGISYLKLSGKAVKINFPLLALILIFSTNFVIIDNGFIKFLNLLFVAVLSVYFLFCLAGAREQDKIGDMFLFDIFKSLTILPFSSLPKAPAAIVHGTKKSGIARKILLMIASLIVAIPLTGIILSLLLSADEAFRTMFNNLFSSLIEHIFPNLMLALFGIPVAFYFFGFLYSGENGMRDDPFTEEKNRNLLKRLKIAPEFIYITAMLPIVLIYILFFVSQLAYFTSAFQSIVPKGFIPSEYAKAGFFQICAVAFINGVLIAVVGLTVKRKETGLSFPFKLYISLLSLLTLLFITTAVSKMALYIGFFGLTPLRLYVTWFLVLLTSVFIIAILKQFIKKMNVTKSVFAVFTLLFALLCFSNVDAVIARYNIDRYKDGSLKELDVKTIYQLSDAAVPYLYELSKDSNEAIADEAGSYLQRIKRNQADINFYNLNMDKLRASKILKDVTLKKEDNNSYYEEDRVYSESSR